jgi:hypothetical protein
MSGPDSDPCQEWLENIVARYRASLHDPVIVGDDATGWIVQAEGAAPAAMAEDFKSVLDPDKLAILLAYAVRRCAFGEMKA